MKKPSRESVESFIRWVLTFLTGMLTLGLFGDQIQTGIEALDYLLANFNQLWDGVEAVCVIAMGFYSRFLDTNAANVFMMSTQRFEERMIGHNVKTKSTVASEPSKPITMNTKDKA